MTNPTSDGEVPEVAPHEELASALVDGEATAPEQERAGEPEVAAAVDTYRGLAALVAQAVDPPAAEARDRAISAALDAFDSDAVRVAPTTVDLGAARRHRWRTPQWIGAVAAALVVLAGLGLLAGLTGGGDDDDADLTAAAPSEQGADASAPADEELGAVGDSFESNAPTAAGGQGITLPYLGEFDDLDSLVQIAGADLAARTAAAEEDEEQATSADAPTTTAAGATPAVPCSAAIGAESPRHRIVGTAILDGQPATVVVDTDDQDARSVVVYAEPDCAPVVARLDE